MPEKIFPVLLPLFEELRGERVLVRPYAEGDAAALQEAVAESREHLRPWLPFADEHQTVDESRAFIRRVTARWLVREDMIVALFDAETGRYLGGSGLHPRGWDLRFFEIGYWVRLSAEGRGYVSEAVRLLTDYAFESLAANRVMIRCDARNLRSAAVARRLGFVQEALLRNDSLAVDGTLRSSLVFALTPDDPRWPPSH
ncbi:MAG: N-acetyltransferase [Chloroflexi bacterium]|nr:MAG: N-acetyltransferase [Chloroflexota bacterium]